MKKFLKVFIIFISGIFVGATLVFVIMKKNLEHMNELMSWEYISSESEAAINAYEFQSPEVGIYAFQRYIQLLKSVSLEELKQLIRKLDSNMEIKEED
jgi:hypothetical protein